MQKREVDREEISREGKRRNVGRYFPARLGCLDPRLRLQVDPLHEVVDHLTIGPTDEPHLLDIGAPEPAIAFMELAHCAIDVKDFVEQRPAVWQRREGVVPELDHVLLKHEDQELFFGFGVEEERSGADVGLIGDLARRRSFETLIRKETLCCRSDALQLLALVALAAPNRLFGFVRLLISATHDCAH